MGESSITYEEIFELLRRERNSEELQNLDPHFYRYLVSYLREKKAVIDDDSEEAQLFGTSEKEKVRIQLANAKKIAKELIERREKKIIILALNKARTESDIIDTSSLLKIEEEFFYKAAELFSAFGRGVIHRMARMEIPVFGNVTEEDQMAEEPEESFEEEENVTVESSSSVKVKKQDIIESDDSEVQTVSEVADNSTLVRFTSSIPQFMGVNEKVYGPYEKDDTAELSPDIANILIKKGKAVEEE